MIVCRVILLIVVFSNMAWALSVEDDSGRVVTIGQPAMRIITLAPHATEHLYALGVGERIVATVEHSDYPKAALSIPRLGGADSISVEKIYAMSPDLVIAWQGGNPPELLAQLERLGLVVYRSSAKSLQGIADTVQRLGKLTGAVERSDELVQDYRQALSELQMQYQSSTRVSVFYQLWSQPLMTANRSLLVSQMIELCAGDNVFADRPEAVPKTSVESVVLLGPDVILAPTQGTPADWKNTWLAWPEIPAVKYQTLYTLDADLVSRPTIRVLEGARQLCKMLDNARTKLSR